MLRLGTRPDRKRMSLPPEPSTCSFSGSMLVIDTGTSWMFSTLRWAVTWTASRVVGLSCAAAASGIVAASAAASRRQRGMGRRDTAGLGFIGMSSGWGADGTTMVQSWPGEAGSEGNLHAVPRPQHRFVAGGAQPGLADGLDVGQARRAVLVQDDQHARA